jgi:hypothetical protein
MDHDLVQAVVHRQVCPDLLPRQLRAAGAQHLLRAALEGLDLAVRTLNAPRMMRLKRIPRPISG